MNQKAYSILFCALLASSFYHEIQAKGVVPHHHGIAKAKDRTFPLIEQCSIQCTFNSTGLQIIVNANVSIVAALNTTSNLAIAVDVKANITAFFNGNTGYVLVVNLTTGEYISFSGSTNVGWLSSKVSLAVFLQVSLSVIYNSSGGTNGTISTITSAVLTEVTTIIVGVEGSIGSDGKAAFNSVIAASIQIVALLSGQLSGILALFVGGAISVGGGIIFIAYVFIGIAKVISVVGVSLQVLISKSISFNFEVLFSQASGIVKFVQIILSLAAVVSVSALQSLGVRVFIEIIVALGGYSSSGTNGIFLILYLYINVTQDNLIVFIVQLLKFAASKTSSTSLEADLAIFAELQSKVNITISVTISFFVASLTNSSSISIDGKEYKNIVSILTGQTGLNIVLQVVAAVAASLSISVITVLIKVFIVLLFLITTQAGVNLLIAVGISGLTVLNIGAISIFTIIKWIAQGVATLLTNIVGTLFTSFTTALSIVQVSVSTFLLQATPFILAFFKFVTKSSLIVASQSDVDLVASINSSVSSSFSFGFSASFNSSSNVSISG